MSTKIGKRYQTAIVFLWFFVFILIGEIVYVNGTAVFNHTHTQKNESPWKQFRLRNWNNSIGYLGHSNWSERIKEWKWVRKLQRKKKRKGIFKFEMEKKCVDVRHWHLILMPELASRFSRARSMKIHSLGPFFYLVVIFDWFPFFFRWLKCERTTGEIIQTKEYFRKIKMRILLMVASH